VRQRWARHLLPGADAGPERRYYKLCALTEPRAGDVWVAGSGRCRSFEECLVAREALRAVQEDGTLPVAIEGDFDHLITAWRPPRRAAGRRRPESARRSAAAGDARRSHIRPRSIGGRDGLVAVESRLAWPAVRWPLSRMPRREADGPLPAGLGR
jgi:hypothetical protein